MAHPWYVPAPFVRQLPTRRQAALGCVLAALSALACGGLLSAALLVPAPAAALPFIVVVCIGCPMLAAWELPASIAALRAGSSIRCPDSLDAWAVDDLVRRLEDLPETEHPLGL
jgi:hypothetical protein